ncbi:MAG: oligosaccharide flippase family protein [Meiothermus sp.]|nr:oligosaccharide flippase family protein [Meiothermus sp.]
MDWLRTFRTNLLLGRFAHSVTLLAGSTFLGQGFLILVSPILTRLYTPEAFGIFAVYSAIVGVLGVLAGLRYELAIPLAGNDEDALELLRLALAINVAISLLVGLVLWGLGDWVVEWTRAPGLAPLLWLIPVGVLGVGFYQSLSYWATRRQDFGALSRTRLSRSVGQGVPQLVLGWLNAGGAGLIWGFVLSQLVGLLPLLRNIKLYPPDISTVIRLAQQYRAFPLINAWSALITNAGAFVPFFLFARYFPLETVGWFALTNRVLSVPANLVGQAIAQVFYPEVAQRQRQGVDVAPLLERTATALLVLGMPVFALVGLGGSWLFSLLFGSEWRFAGLYAQILAPFFLISFVSSPLSSFALVQGRQLESLWISIFNILAVALAVAVGVWQGSATVAVAVFSSVESLIYLAYLAWIFSLAKGHLWAWLSGMRAFWLGWSGALLGVGFLTHYLPWVGLGLGGVTFGLLTFWAWRRYVGAI